MATIWNPCFGLGWRTRLLNATWCTLPTACRPRFLPFAVGARTEVKRDSCADDRSPEYGEINISGGAVARCSARRRTRVARTRKVSGRKQGIYRSATRPLVTL